MKITNHLEEVTVFESTADSFRLSNPNIKVIHGLVSSIDTTSKIIHFKAEEVDGMTFFVIINMLPLYLGMSIAG